jgi:multidrug efflux system membrane fusion protein
MLDGLFKLLVAAGIAFGIVTYVTGGDYAQVSEAANKAIGQSMDRKREREAAKAAAAQPAPEQEKAVAINVVTKASRAEPLASSLRMTGATEASRRVDVRAETSGVVAQAPRKGQRVNRGDLLCRLETGDRKARRDAAVARLQQALTNARAQQTLRDKGFAAANRADELRVNAEVIRSEIMQLDVEMDRLMIRAPFDGLIEGETAQIGSLLQPGTACATVVDPDPLKVAGFVPEFQIGKLSLGDRAEATLVTGQTVTGRISYIAQTADTATRTFPNPR